MSRSNGPERDWMAIFAVAGILLLVLGTVSYVFFPMLMWTEQRAEMATRYLTAKTAAAFALGIALTALIMSVAIV